MTPLGLTLSLCLAILVLFLPRRVAAVGVIAAVCYFTEGQPLGLVCFHFTAIRLVLLFGLIRVLARGELRRLRFNAIDRALFTFTIATLILSVLRVGTTEELVYQVGVLYNASLSYLVFRSLLWDLEDLREVLAKVAYVIIPFALLMLVESHTGRNVFAAFGGVAPTDMVRDGALRAQGAFRSPITAGAFGATFSILFGSLLFAGGCMRPALIGLVASTVIVMSSHSSGPLLGMGLGFLALLCWPWRRQTRKIRWGIVITLVVLQLAMKVPVWFIIGRISDVVGGGGYHRAYVIDQFVRHFSSWWLAGTSDTGDWMATRLDSGGSDLTNKFVSDGVNAGLVGLILSIVLVVKCFQFVGAAMRSNQGNGVATERMLWGIGATLVGTIGILFSVTYFDQMYVIWHFLLGTIAGTKVGKRKIAVSRVAQPVTLPRQRALTVYRDARVDAKASIAF
jgi:hypothetical protein